MPDNLASILLPTAYQDTDAAIVEGPFTIASATYRLGSGLSRPYPLGAPLIPKGAGQYAPTSAPTAGAGITTGNLVSNGHYSWSMSLVTDWGETIPGKVTGVTITSGGTGYTSAPTVAFSAPTGTGGVTATGTAQISGGAVTGITITNPGSGYVNPPTVTLTGGGFTSAATATSIVNVLTISALGTGNTGQVINLPGWTARLDNPVRSRRLYRTVNNGTQLYLVAEIYDANQTVYIDEVSDTELLSGGASTPTAPTSNTSGSAINPGSVDVFDGTTHWTEIPYVSGSPPSATKTFAVDYSVLTGGYVYFYSGDVGTTNVTITYHAGTLLSSTWINQYQAGLQEIYNYFRTESTPIFTNGLQVNGGLTSLASSTFQEEVFFNDLLDSAVSNGVINVGDGPFDGVSTGRFIGNSHGTYIAANALSTNNNLARLIDLQWGGTSMFSVDGQGTVSVHGQTFSSTSTSGLYFTASNDLAAPGSVWFFGNSGLAGSITTQEFFTIQPNISQSGSAGYTALTVNVLNENSLGSGTKRILDCQVSNVSKMYVDNKGKTSVSTLAVIGGGTPTVAAGAGLGTGPTISVAAGSTDASGLINFTVGTGPSGGTQFTVTFSAAFPSAPRLVVIWFQGTNAGLATVSSFSASSFAVGSSGFTAGASYGIGWMLVF